MKIYFSKYRDHWISPYTIIEFVLRREVDYDDPKIEKWADRLEPISRAIQWVWDRVHPPIYYVKIDRYDVWNMNNTLARIVLPMLKILKDSKHGAPFVDPQDVPISFYPKEDADDTNGYVDDTHFQRWDWVLDEIIWAFEQMHPDSNWEDQYHKGEHDFVWKPCKWDANGKPSLYEMEKGPKDTHEFDAEGYQRHQERIQNGLRLFGKYYQALWD